MFLIDAHCDTLYRRAWEAPKPPDVTPERLREGGVSLQVCALWSGPEGPGKSPSPEEYIARERERLPELTRAGLRLVDDPRSVEAGENCLMLSIEGGEAIGESLDLLRAYRRLGVRLLTLTWNFENAIGTPHCLGAKPGLKPFGWDAVREMNRLGMACDVSHLNEGGFWDLIERNDLPPMASHSCCRALCDHTRNLTDEQIRALIERGGWIGVNFFNAFLTGGEATAMDIVRHIDRIAALGGIRHVGFGSDFDGISAAPEGMTHPGCFPYLLDTLREHGYAEAEIEGIAGENFLRYMDGFAGEV